MNNYFRITAYSPTLNVSFIIDSVNRYDEIWEFSADLISKKCKIIAVSDSDTFEDGNIPKRYRWKKYILLKCNKLLSETQ